jgi:Type III restriction enzyme, res subunit
MEALAPAPPTFRLAPRPYQYEAVAALLAATARGMHRPLLVLPTGTGKTIGKRSDCQNRTLAFTPSDGIPCRHGYAFLITPGTLGTDSTGNPRPH